MEIISVVAAASALIGFLSIWVKLGVEKGEQKKAVEQIGQQLLKQKNDIEALQKETHDIRLDIAKSFAKIEVTLEYIKETVALWKEERRAKTK